jgi:ribonuclease R
VTYRLGDPVRARLVEAAPFAGALRFEIVSDSEDATARQGPRRLRTDPRERKQGRKVARR